MTVGYSPTRERELWGRFGSERDQAARRELVSLYMPFARRLAGRYADVNEPYDDLIQVASLGLLNAIDRFDPTKGIPFIGFASPTILGELKRHFRDKVWTVRVPRGIHDLLARVERASADLSLDLQRSPTVPEIAARLGVEVGEILEALEAKERRRTLSLDRPPTQGDEEEGAAEWLGDEDQGYASVEDRLAMEAALPELSGRAREALKLRFIDDLTQSEIAARLGISQMQVSRILRRTLAAIRVSADEQDPDRIADDLRSR